LFLLLMLSLFVMKFVTLTVDVQRLNVYEFLYNPNKIEILFLFV
uniref:NADH dehydrogenase subunit 1 n=1 Tax=Brugia timori TaxID=42155 RepID=A0A0R3RDB0_9BILA